MGLLKYELLSDCVENIIKFIVIYIDFNIFSVNTKDLHKITCGAQ